MNKMGWVILATVVFCAACGGESSTSNGGGGAGGTTASGGSSGGTGGATASGGTGGATGGTGGATSMQNVYDNNLDTEVTDCGQVAPAPGEDGTFSVTIFGPFPKEFAFDTFTFVAAESTKAAITKPWTASVIVVPAGQAPTAVDPSADAKPYPLMELQSIPADPATFKQLAVTLDAPLSVGVMESVVVSLRNTEGTPGTALVMCGTGPSEHPDTNQWWALDGTMATMASYGATFDRDWWVSLVPSPN